MNIQFLNKNTLWILWSLTQETHEKVQKGSCMPSEGSQILQKDELSKRLCLEGWPPERWFSWSTSPSKLLMHDPRISFKKSNVTWQDPKETLTSLKSWWIINGYFSSSVIISTCWKRKLYLLFLVLDQWIKRAQDSRSTSFNRYTFGVYKKLEDNEEVVREFGHSMKSKAFIFLNSLNYYKLLIVISKLKNLLFWFVLANILILRS